MTDAKSALQCVYRAGCVYVTRCESAGYCTSEMAAVVPTPPSSKDVTAERYQCVGGSMYIYRDGLVNEPILFVLATDYDRMLALGETYERDYKRLLEAGTRMRVEIERLTEAVADKESDCARLHSALMDAKYPETAQVETSVALIERPYSERLKDADSASEGEVWVHRKTGKTCTVLKRVDRNLTLRHQSGRVTFKWAPYLASEFDLRPGQKTNCSGDADAS